MILLMAGDALKMLWGLQENNNYSFVLCQVERRLVNQLAMAHENGLITPGCTVFVYADLPKSEEEKYKLQDSPSPIRIRVKGKGTDNFTDVDPSTQLKSSSEEHDKK